MKYQTGITLIELMVVIAIIGIIIAFGMTLDLNAFKGDTFRAEQATIVSALERARSHAMANMCTGASCTNGKPYGVCFDNSNPSKPNYVVFQGSVCTAIGSDLFPANTAVSAESGFPAAFPPTIVFEQLTGKLTPSFSGTESPCLINEKKIPVAFQGKTASICINNEGRINW